MRWLEGTGKTNKVVRWVIGLLLNGLILSLITACQSSGAETGMVRAISQPSVLIELPVPKTKGTVSLEEALQERRSIRDYTGDPLTLSEVSQILWAAQGITSYQGGRTAPSAGGLYPLEIYLIAGRVRDLAAGIYKYMPEIHKLAQVTNGDLRERLCSASVNQPSIKNAPASLVIAAVYERTKAKYGDRAERFVNIEVGHAAQNICLEVTALGLGAVTIGAFDDNQVKEVVGLTAGESPLYIIPVGKR